MTKGKGIFVVRTLDGSLETNSAHEVRDFMIEYMFKARNLSGNIGEYRELTELLRTKEGRLYKKEDEKEVDAKATLIKQKIVTVFYNSCIKSEEIECMTNFLIQCGAHAPSQADSFVKEPPTSSKDHLGWDWYHFPVLYYQLYNKYLFDNMD